MIVKSQRVAVECILRLPSSPRWDQVESLLIDGWTHDTAKLLEKHRESGLIAIQRPLVLAEVDGNELLFEGTEEEVLQKILAIAVPKTPRTVSVKMAAQRAAVVAERMGEVYQCLNPKRRIGAVKDLSEEAFLQMAARVREIMSGHKPGFNVDEVSRGNFAKQINQMLYAATKVDVDDLQSDAREQWFKIVDGDLIPSKAMDFALFFLRAETTEDVLKEGYALWATKSVMTA